MRTRTLLWIPLALLPAITTGCALFQHQQQPTRVGFAEDAGSTHIAVLSVARWDDYVLDLQPAFTLSEADALTRASATTAQLQDEFVHSIAAALQLAPPTSSATTQTTGSTKTTTTATGPGNVNNVPAPTALSGTALPTAPALPAGAPSLEALLQYQAATALFQEVKLLSRYLHDAVAGKNFDPYVVRMQITLMPYARLEPYDAYSTVSFFYPWGLSRNSAPANTATTEQILADSTPIVVPLLVTDNVEAASHSSAIEQIRQSALSVLFMVHGFSGSGSLSDFSNQLKTALGTDYNSLLTVSRLTDNTYSVRLGAMRQVETPFEMVPRTHNVTFLLLVPRDPDFKQQYDSTKDRVVQLVSRTELRDADTGVELPHRTPGPDFAKLRGDLDYYRKHGLLELGKMTSKEKDRLVFALIEQIERNDSRGFFQLLNIANKPINPLPLRSLWLDMSTDMANSRYAATSFELPAVKPPERFVPQSAVVTYSPMGGSGQVTLEGGRYIAPAGLSGILHLHACTSDEITAQQDKARDKAKPVPPPAAAPGCTMITGDPSPSPAGGHAPSPGDCAAPAIDAAAHGLDQFHAFEKAGQGVDVAASSITVPPTGDSVSFSFSSLANLSVAPQGWLEVKARERFADAPGATCDGSSCYYPAVLVSAKPLAISQVVQDFWVAVPASAVLATTGNGSLTVEVQNLSPSTSVHFDVAGADIASITAPNGQQLDAVNRTILSGTVQVGLANLVTGGSVVVTTWKEPVPDPTASPAASASARPPRLYQQQCIVAVKDATPPASGGPAAKPGVAPGGAPGGPGGQ